MSDAKVVTTPPEGNLGVSLPGERQMTDNCRHVFVPMPHPLDIPTGYDICLNCRVKVPAQARQQGPFYRNPDDSYTGYRRL
jgi:hypothetical protein